MTQTCAILEKSTDTSATEGGQEVLLPRVRLKAEGLSFAFGGQQVLRGVNLDLKGGQIALLCGSNGCGKTTLLNVLSGFLKPDAGAASIEFNGTRVDILKETPDRLVRLGLARLWQDNRLFLTMTVLENVLAASPHAIGINPALALFALGKVKQQEREFRSQALAWLDMLGMADRADSSCDKLSFGQSKRVAIARMLQTGSKVLLLDEPLAGLDQDSVAKLVEDLNRLAKATHRTMLIVEHKHDAITSVCDIRFTLEEGRLYREDLEGKLVGRAMDAAAVEKPFATRETGGQIGPLTFEWIGGQKRDSGDAPLLQLEHVSVRVGQRLVLDDVSLEVFKGEQVRITGDNGAGKSTLLNAITGVLPLNEGRILFKGEDISKLHTHERTARGIRYMRQQDNVFPSLTVSENLQLAVGKDGYERFHVKFPEWVKDIAANQPAGMLSGGQKQKLAWGMAVLSSGDILLADEPSAGVTANANMMSQSMPTTIYIEHN